MLHYLAECTGTDDCTTFDAANAKWFKIDQVDFESDGKTWVQQRFRACPRLFLGIEVLTPDRIRQDNVHLAAR